MGKDPEIIKSRDNSRLKCARRTRDGRESAMVFIEGARLAEEALRSPLVIVEAFIEAGRVEQHPALLSKLYEMKVRVNCVDTKLFPTIADTSASQGIILLAERPSNGFADLRLKGSGPNASLVIFLSKVNNPANLGAVLRSSEASGVSVVMVSEGSADPYSPKSLRASMGSAFRLSVIRDIGFEDAVSFAEDNGLLTTAADVNGRTEYTHADWNVPRMLIFGSEAHGLDEKQLSEVRDTVRVPLENGVESLNLAVSAGIILFEALRQRVAKR